MRYALKQWFSREKFSLDKRNKESIGHRYIFQGKERNNAAIPDKSVCRQYHFRPKQRNPCLLSLTVSAVPFFDQQRKQMVVGILEENVVRFAGHGQILLLWEEMNVDEGEYLNSCLRGAKQNEESIRHARSARAMLSRAHGGYAVTWSSN